MVESAGTSGWAGLGSGGCSGGRATSRWHQWLWAGLGSRRVARSYTYVDACHTLHTYPTCTYDASRRVARRRLHGGGATANAGGYRRHAQDQTRAVFLCGGANDRATTRMSSRTGAGTTQQPSCCRLLCVAKPVVVRCRGGATPPCPPLLGRGARAPPSLESDGREARAPPSLDSNLSRNVEPRSVVMKRDQRGASAAVDLDQSVRARRRS